MDFVCHCHSTLILYSTIFNLKKIFLFPAHTEQPSNGKVESDREKKHVSSSFFFAPDFDCITFSSIELVFLRAFPQQFHFSQPFYP